MHLSCLFLLSSHLIFEEFCFFEIDHSRLPKQFPLMFVESDILVGIIPIQLTVVTPHTIFQTWLG